MSRNGVSLIVRTRLIKVIDTMKIFPLRSRFTKLPVEMKTGIVALVIAAFLLLRGAVSCVRYNTTPHPPHRWNWDFFQADFETQLLIIFIVLFIAAFCSGTKR